MIWDFFFFLKAFSSHLTHHSFHLRIELEEPCRFWAWGTWWNTDKVDNQPWVSGLPPQASELGEETPRTPPIVQDTVMGVASWALLTLSIYVKLDLVSGMCSHDPGFTDSLRELCRSGCQPGSRGLWQGLQETATQLAWPAESIGEVEPGRKHYPIQSIVCRPKNGTVTQPWTSASRAQKAGSAPQVPSFHLEKELKWESGNFSGTTESPTLKDDLIKWMGQM